MNDRFKLRSKLLNKSGGGRRLHPAAYRINWAISMIQQLVARYGYVSNKVWKLGELRTRKLVDRQI